MILLHIYEYQMGPLDIPEILIALSLAGFAAWAVYNRLHGHPSK
jgi:hypothetical protein